MDFLESEEQTLLRASVYGIAAKYGHDYYAREARGGGKADALWRELAEAGFLGVNLPAEHGGAGLGISELAIVCEELARAGAPFLLLIVSPAICGTIIAKYGTPEQRSAFLPALCAGSKKMAFAITEPDAGSNSHEIATRAVRDGRGYRLNGTKYFISGHDEADNVLVVANTGPGPAGGRARLSLFVVPTNAPGLLSAKTVIALTSVAQLSARFPSLLAAGGSANTVCVSIETSVVVTCAWTVRVTSPPTARFTVVEMGPA